MDTLSNAELLEQVLNSELGSSTSKAVNKSNYRELVAFGNLTSFSMQQVFRACPRKFQLEKLGADLSGDEERESNCDFAFGHAVGAGVAVFDETQDLQAALWACFLAWNIDLLEEPVKKPNRPPSNKTVWHALWAIHVYQVFRDEETDLAEYDSVKTEATIAVDFEDGHYYVGHIDQLLRHKYTGRYKVKENKTTVFGSVDPALYSNSDQALSYALVVDQLGEAEFDVLYTIYSSTEQRWISFEFTKSVLKKAEWLQGQFFMHDQIEVYSEYNLFPKNGASCIEYGRRCVHYENCDFNQNKVFRKKFSELEQIQSLEQLNEIERLDFSFKLSDLKQTLKSATRPAQPLTPDVGSSLEEM